MSIGVDISGGIVRYVIFVSEQKLQPVTSQWEGDRRFRLSGSEMQMIEVVRNGSAQRRHFGVDQQVVLALSTPAGATPILARPK